LHLSQLKTAVILASMVTSTEFVTGL